MAASSRTFAIDPNAAVARTRTERAARAPAYRALPAGPLEWLRIAFFALVARPILFVSMGVNVFHRERLPAKRPAILVANHNSHFDTMALLSLFPLRDLRHVRPVAAADYFDKKNLFGWFFRNIIGVVLLPRTGARGDVLAPLVEALRAGEVLIFFPEGTRGEPGRMGPFKSGLGRVVERCPDVPVIPIHLRGIERILPRGASVPLPLTCDVTIGEPMILGSEEPSAFVESVRDRVMSLGDERRAPTRTNELEGKEPT